MGESEQVPGSSGEKPGQDPDAAEDAREAGLIRDVLRAQEEHREGGVDPELDETNEDH